MCNGNIYVVPEREAAVSRYTVRSFLEKGSALSGMTLLVWQDQHHILNVPSSETLWKGQFGA